MENGARFAQRVPRAKKWDMRDLLFPLRSVFVALPLENQAKWQFQALQETLRPFGDLFRFQNPQRPHITMQFFPEVMQIEYHQIQAQTAQLSANRPPFTLHIEKAETFNDRVLTLRIAFSQELARLKKACPWPDPKLFRPHTTLARMQNPQKFLCFRKKVLKALGDVRFDIPVDCLRLYAERDGRKQTPLQDFPFCAF